MIKRHTALADNTLVISLSAVLLGLVAGAILIVCIGENPFIAFSYLFRGGLMNVERIGNTLATATTLLLVGLSVSFAFKTGLFNIGGSGQMLIGGLLGSMFALSATSMPRPLFFILLILIGVAGGAVSRSIKSSVQCTRSRFHHYDELDCLLVGLLYRTGLLKSGISGNGK